MFGLLVVEELIFCVLDNINIIFKKGLKFTKQIHLKLNLI